jgi:hypothetical protein
MKQEILLRTTHSHFPLYLEFLAAENKLKKRDFGLEMKRRSLGDD